MTFSTSSPTTTSSTINACVLDDMSPTKAAKTLPGTPVSSRSPPDNNCSSGSVAAKATTSRQAAPADAIEIPTMDRIVCGSTILVYLRKRALMRSRPFDSTDAILTLCRLRRTAQSSAGPVRSGRRQGRTLSAFG